MKRVTQNLKFRLPVGIALLFGASVYAMNEYRAKELGQTRLQITTPYGEKVYSGNFRLDNMRHYKITIPLDDLRPAGAEDAEEEDSDDAPPEIPDRRLPEPSPSPSPLPSPGVPLASPPPEFSPRKPDSADNGPDSDDISRLVMEANHNYNHGKFYEAMLSVEQILKRRPNYVRAWVMKGSLLYIQGYKDLAKDAWENARKLDPDNAYVRELSSRYR